EGIPEVATRSRLRTDYGIIGDRKRTSGGAGSSAERPTGLRLRMRVRANDAVPIDRARVAQVLLEIAAIRADIGFDLARELEGFALPAEHALALRLPEEHATRDRCLGITFAHGAALPACPVGCVGDLLKAHDVLAFAFRAHGGSFHAAHRSRGKRRGV